MGKSFGFASKKHRAGQKRDRMKRGRKHGRFAPNPRVFIGCDYGKDEDCFVQMEKGEGGILYVKDINFVKKAITLSSTLSSAPQPRDRFGDHMMDALRYAAAHYPEKKRSRMSTLIQNWKASGVGLILALAALCGLGWILHRILAQLD